jgi:hypothetical protein
MVVGDIALQCDFHLVRRAAAVKLPTGEAAGAGRDAVVDQRVK